MVITNKSTLTSKVTLPDETEKEISTDSNESTAVNMSVALVKEKTSAKEFGEPLEEILQTLVLTNNSEYEISTLSIQETISEGATFKAGSVTIDDTPYEDYDIVTGVELPAPIEGNGDSTTITYTLVIDENPEVESITTKSTLNYMVNEADLTEDTSEISISLLSNKIKIEKTSNASAVVSGQTLTYQNIITNEGSLTNTELFFTDPIPEGTTFVEGSVKIDDVEQPDYDPATGFALDDLDVGGSVKITFDVTIN